MANRYWVGGTGTWNTSSTTNWSASSGGASGASVPTATDSVFFDQAGTYTVTMTGALTCLDITVSAGTVTFTSTGTLAISGSMSLVTGTIWSATGTITFNATTAKTITTSAVTIFASITLNGVGGTWQLQDALTLDATRTLTFTNGTFDLNGKTLTTGLFNSNNTNTRTLAFGTGVITCIAAGGTMFTVNNSGTGLTVTGTPTVNISNSGAVATTVTIGPLSESNSISFNFTTGTYALTFMNVTNNGVRNVNFTGFAGTLGATFATNIYGSLTISSGMTLTASSSVMTFAATSGTQLITSNAKTIDFPVRINGVGGTFKLADALTLGSTRSLQLLNGTFDGDNKTISGASFISMNLGVLTLKNVSTALTFTHSDGAITLGANNQTGDYTFTQGTLDLASYNLTAGTFTSDGLVTRTMAFGTGKIICTSPGPNGAAGRAFILATTGVTVTGTPVVDLSYSGSLGSTITSSAFSETQSISFNFTAGTYPLSFLTIAGHTAKNVNFTGFAGTLGTINTSTIYGNLTLSTGMTLSANTVGPTFGATSGTQIITSNAKTMDFPITVNGVGGTVRLADALLMGTTRILTHTNGTIDLNGKTLTVGTRYLTATGTKNITFNGGTLVCPVSNTTSFNNAAPTGFTTTAGTGTGKISMTVATAKTFVGGGSTYNCTLSNDGAGALTVSGSNTFTTIANGVQPTAFTFTAATTQTVTDWNVSGTAGNLVTIISSTAGVPALLSKASGTVSSDYLSLKDSTATGGAVWYAGANSTNVSGNLGWLFSAAPVNNYAITALNGAYTLNGQSIGVYKGRSLTGGYGSYSITGQSATLTRGFLLSPQNGLYSLTGQAVDIVYTPAPPVTGPTQYFIEIRSFTESRRI